MWCGRGVRGARQNRGAEDGGAKGVVQKEGAIRLAGGAGGLKRCFRLAGHPASRVALESRARGLLFRVEHPAWSRVPRPGQHRGRAS
ncbi:Hypothetical protein CAP_4762 [Chondromyces apiculatus DSM 436]|uniref:Uncharacterized protein n=1 Tax=Chondromyces apiculatus DSM 436 TaxID=1192034 RepID=A0A017T662_9BACT|nr:Hypothetical protein CAP_4762 [Chondromyces apiculatus DSM 436]